MIVLEDVTKRLTSFGYTVTEADSWVLGFIIDKVSNQIKKECGSYDSATSTIIIPEALKQVAVDKVVAEFLLAKKSTGQLTGFDFAAAVKSIQEGDTNVTFAIGAGSMTPEERMDALIAFLNRGDNSIASYRKITW